MPIEMKHNWPIELQENDGKLEIWRSDTVGFEMGILFEFVPEHSDLPKEMVKSFAEQLVKLWNIAHV